MQDEIVGLLIAVAVHAAAFVIGGAAFVKPPAYGIEPGGIEVNLIAALPPGTDAGTSPVPPMAFAAAGPPPVPAGVLRPQAAGARPHPFSALGDGSALIPGADPTTRYRTGGGRTNARPNRLRNPAPPYPELSKKRGEEGLVLLRVMVDASGHPTKVQLAHSSGFPLLDESALHAVQRWTFMPAHAGPLTVDAVVEIPIRFRLEDQQGL